MAGQGGLEDHAPGKACENNPERVTDLQAKRSPAVIWLGKIQVGLNNKKQEKHAG
jgi:hypothetical protein